MKNIIIITWLNIIFVCSLIGQEVNPISQARKDNVIKLLNYRFKGGYYTLEKLFNTTVTYPELAKAHCVVGISIVSITVNCDVVIEDLKIKTALGYGIDNAISAFFNSTEGKWNTCTDNKYTHFEVPIQFILKGTETTTDDALLLIEEDNPGYLCNPDEYYIKRIEKYMDKGKWNKALPYIDMMIRRDPYNTDYFDYKKKAINGGEL